MRVLVIGSGAREHAIVHAISRSSCRPEILCTPGNAGIAQEARILEPFPEGPEGIDRLLAEAGRLRPDLTIVGPEAPLVLGIVDRFEAAGFRIFGPSKSASRLEGSKCFTKEFLARHGIPTARFRIFEDAGRARAHVEKVPLPVVLKADGLAAGKGVIVAQGRKEAVEAVEAILVERRFGAAGSRVVVEDCLRGSEISFFIVTDGESYVPFETAQDYKPALDGDRGPNTGGMGSYSPYHTLVDPRIVEITERIVRPTLEGLRKDGITYRGILYVGIMLTSDGPQVLEFNVRLGDPEAEALLPRLRTDMVELVEKTLAGKLADFRLVWDPRPAVTVVAASPGYPGKYPTGRPITGLDSVTDPDVKVFHAGTRVDADGRVVTAGGRVLAISALGATRREARERAYDALAKIRFDGMHSRSDIGAEGR